MRSVAGELLLQQVDLGSGSGDSVIDLGKAEVVFESASEAHPVLADRPEQPVVIRTALHVEVHR